MNSSRRANSSAMAWTVSRDCERSIGTPPKSFISFSNGQRNREALPMKLSLRFSASAAPVKLPSSTIRVNTCIE